MHKLFKLFLSFLVAFVGFIGIKSVKAATMPTSIKGIYHNTVLNYNGYDSLYFQSNGTYQVFCTTFHVPGVGSSCSISSSQWSTPVASGVAAIVDKYNTEKSYKNYYYAELAINEFLYYYNGKNSVNRISTVRDVRNAYSITKAYYTKAVDAYNAANKEYKISVSPSNVTFSLSGNYYVSNKLTVSSTNGSVGSYSVSLSGDVKGEVYNKSGNSFYVRVPKSSIKTGTTSNITVTVNGTRTINIAKRFDCGSYNQVVTPNVTTTTTKNASAKATGKIVLKGNKIEVNKIDAETKKAVSGATLVVKNSAGKVIYTINTNGKTYEIKNLDAGNYTLEETKAPSGYSKSSEIVKFTAANDNKTVTINYKNNKLKNRVEIKKTDATTSKEIEGAHLVVKNSAGKVVDEWTSTKEAHIIKDLQAGKYTLSETIAPEGYRLKTTTVEFTVKGDGSTTKVEMKNELKNKTIVKVNKLDADTKKAVSGATLVIKNSNGKVVKTIKTEGKTVEIKDLQAGKYTLEETVAPYGYMLTTTKSQFTVANDDKVITIDVLNKKHETRVEVRKTDATTSKEIEGAHLVVKNSAGKVVDEWTSTKEAHVIKGLEEGKYTLSETIAPKGYRLKTTTVEFTVKRDGSTTKVEMKNELKNKTIIRVNKLDATTKKAVSGATLVIKNSNGKVVKTIKTEGKAVVINNLEEGKYTLSETNAPSGYQLSKEVKSFTVANDDKVVTIDYLNRKYETRVEVRKTDATTSKEIEGAHLVVKNSAGKVVDEWTSTKEAHVIKGLEEGKYTLSETIAPKGYRLKTTTVEFTVKRDGSTTKVEMKNELMDKTIIRVNKIDSETKAPLKGATLVIKNSTGKVVKTIKTEGNTVEFNDLELGNYTLEEIDAPDNYILSTEKINFMVSHDDKIIELNFKNSKRLITNLLIVKKDSATDSELAGAHLVVKDSNGKVIDDFVSTESGHIIKDIKAGSYTLTELEAPEGYVKATAPITFTVKEDGETKKVVMYNSKETTPVPPAPQDPKKHQVEISKQDITTKTELAGATLIIKDAQGNEIDRWVSGYTPHYIELEEGNYTLTEIQAPTGYDLSYEVVNFTVGNTTDITRVVMYNSKTPNTSGRNITYMIGIMFTSIIGAIGSIFKLKLKKNR